MPLDRLPPDLDVLLLEVKLQLHKVKVIVVLVLEVLELVRNMGQCLPAGLSELEFPLLEPEGLGAMLSLELALEEVPLELGVEENASALWSMSLTLLVVEGLWEVVKVDQLE